MNKFALTLFVIFTGSIFTCAFGQNKIVKKDKTVIHCDKIFRDIDTEEKHTVYYNVTEGNEIVTRDMPTREVAYITDNAQDYIPFFYKWFKINKPYKFDLEGLNNRFYLGVGLNTTSIFKKKSNLWHDGEEPDYYWDSAPAFYLGYTRFFSKHYGVGFKGTYASYSSKYAFDVETENGLLYRHGEYQFPSAKSMSAGFSITRRSFFNVLNSSNFFNIEAALLFTNQNLSIEHYDYTAIGTQIVVEENVRHSSANRQFLGLSLNLGAETVLSEKRGLSLDYSIGYHYDFIGFGTGVESYNGLHLITFNLGFKFGR